MGLGMASPFLAVGFVPSVARFIPRPGDWMVRFKEFCGFTLLGTALWLMNPLPSEVILPTLIMLLGLGLGLWMIGSLYDHSSTFNRKMTVRFYALLTTGLICWFGFTKYQEGELLAEAKRNDTHVAMTGDLPWEPFSGARLQDLLREGKPVLIDFTADWCLVCKQNEEVALNTEATNAFVRKNGVVTLYADYTRMDAEIQQWLEKFGSISVPLTVIFPEGDPQHPHILGGPYTQSTLLSLLEQSVAGNVPGDDQQSARLEHALRK
jgi:thiol:disulfide interchange protein DsbD